MAKNRQKPSGIGALRDGGRLEEVSKARGILPLFSIDDNDSDLPKVIYGRQNAPKMKTEKQWLYIIAKSAMMATKSENGIIYSLLNGTEIPYCIAESLIKKGIIVGNKDGLFGYSQTYQITQKSG